MFDKLSEESQEELQTYLARFVTARRQARIQQVLSQRTRFLTVVLEDIFQPHNASAVLRSCECFGVQNVHLIQNYNAFRPNKQVVMGASQWLTLHHYRRKTANNTAACLTELQRQGYRIAAATLRENSVQLQDLSLDQPLALCFGTEEEGLTNEAHELADLFVQIPISGFTQSFNISVTVALFLYELANRLRATDLPWHLTAVEKRALTLDWYVNSISGGKIIVRDFLQRHGEHAAG